MFSAEKVIIYLFNQDNKMAPCSIAYLYYDKV